MWCSDSAMIVPAATRKPVSRSTWCASTATSGGPVQPSAAEGAGAAMLDENEGSESVVLDLVEPVVAGWWGVDESWGERWDEGERSGGDRLTRD